MAEKKNQTKKVTRYRYWKLEEKNRKWKLMPDTSEGLRDAEDKGAMFCTWMNFSEPYKGNGQPEPVRCGDFPLDFDCAADIGKALNDMKNLCLIHLPEFYDIDPHEMRFYCSGGKGFHAMIPAKFLGAEDGDPYLPVIYKAIATDWASRFSLKTLDISLYAMGMGKMFRLPFVKRSNGRSKVPLDLEQVRTLDVNALMKLSEK